VLRRQALHESGEVAAPEIVGDVLRSPGCPLDFGSRAFMESRFAHDFSHVRVHTDARAAESARAVQASAYTVGKDIVFGANQYAPSTHVGRRLLAHELAHVVQQSAPAATGPLLVGAASAPEEREADGAAAAALSPGPPARVSQHAAPAVARDLSLPGEPETAVKVHVTKKAAVVYTNAGMHVYPLARPHTMNPGTYRLTVTITGNRVHLEADAETRKRIGPDGFDAPFAVRKGQPNPSKFFTHGGTITVLVGDLTLPEPGKPSKEEGGGKKPIGGTTPTPTGKTGEQGQRTSGPAGEQTKEAPAEKKEASTERAVGAGLEGGEGKPATDMAFPARLEGPETQVIGGTGSYAMRLDYTVVGRSLIEMVPVAARWVTYHWEVYDITESVKQALQKPAGHAVQPEAPGGAKRKAESEAAAGLKRKPLITKDMPEASTVGRSDAAVQGAQRTLRETQEDFELAGQRFRDAVKEGDVGKALTNLVNRNPGLVGLSGAVRLAGDVLGGVADVMGNTFYEREIPWKRPGTFVIRVIAQPDPIKMHDGSEQRRAASVAIKTVHVKPLESIAKDALADMDARREKLRALRILLQAATDPKQRASLQYEIDELARVTETTSLEVLRQSLAKKRALLKDYESRGLIFDARDVRREIEQLETQIGHATTRVGRGAFRPAATIVSEVTGEHYPLLLQMEVVASPQKGAYAAQLSDVSTADGGLYNGTGPTPNAAAREAFKDMAGGNDYGRGSLVVMLPPVPSAGIVAAEFSIPNREVDAALARTHLRNLVKALSVAAIVVQPLGAAAAIVGAAAAADNLVHRWGRDTLKLDGAAIADLATILAAAAMGATKIGAVVVKKGARDFFLAVEAGDAEAAAAAAGTVTKAQGVTNVAGKTAEYIGKFQIAHASKDILDRFRDINKLEAEDKISHAEARRQRLHLVGDVLQQTAQHASAEATRARAEAKSVAKGIPKEMPQKGAQQAAEPVPAHETTAKKTGETRRSEEPPPEEEPLRSSKPTVGGESARGAETETTPSAAAKETAAGLPEKPPPTDAKHAALRQELKPLGPMSPETEAMLAKNPKLKEALLQSPRAARVLKKCNTPCYPEMSPSQIRRLEQHLEKLSKTGQVDEVLLNEFLAHQRKIGRTNEAIDVITQRDMTTAELLNTRLEEWTVFLAKKTITIGPSPGTKAKQQMERQRSHDIGVKHGKEMATKGGLVDIKFDNPFAETGAFGQGFDDIMVRGGDLDTGIVHVVEYKGGSADLSPGQMSLAWVLGNIRRLYYAGRGATDQHIALKLAKALREGRLEGTIFRTPVDRGIPGETTTEERVYPVYFMKLE
jgi:hypothetical protein